MLPGCRAAGLERGTVHPEPRYEYDPYDDPVIVTRGGAFPVSHEALRWLVERIDSDDLDDTLDELGGPLGLRAQAVCLPGDERDAFVT